MKSIIKFIILALLPLQTMNEVLAQAIDSAEYPKIGKPMIDFNLRDIHYYKKITASLEDFKGKWLVLDFFSVGCLSCFESFPKVNQLMKDFESEIEFMVIGYDNKLIRPSYEKARQRLSLQLPIAYDSGGILFKKFGVSSVPHIIVIDKDGIVRAITFKIERENLRNLLDGKNPRFEQKLNTQQEQQQMLPYDRKKPLLINGNGGSDTTFLFRSVLAKYNGVKMNNPEFVSMKYFGNQVQLVGISISDLYYYAYGDTVFSFPDPRGSSYGKYWNKPLLEVSDPSEFHSGSSDNRYNYSLIVAPERASTQYLQRIMRNDLQNYFGYNVNVESRMMPCWKLIATEEAKNNLKSPNNHSNSQFPQNGGISFRDRPVSFLISQIWLYQQFEPPFIDETGIIGNINVDIDALLTDLTDLRKGLRQMGFDLIKGEKEMKVVVISDKKDW